MLLRPGRAAGSGDRVRPLTLADLQAVAARLYAATDEQVTRLGGISRVMDYLAMIEGDRMSSSDSRVFEALVERVEALERRVTALSELAEGRDLSGELYGAEVDHTAERAERAEIGRRVPRPGGVR